MAGRFHLGDRIPAVLTRQELAEGLGYSLRQIDDFRRAKNHPAVKPLDCPGQVRFDGHAVIEWLEGGAAEPRRRPLLSLARGRR